MLARFSRHFFINLRSKNNNIELFSVCNYLVYEFQFFEDSKKSSKYKYVMIGGIVKVKHIFWFFPDKKIYIIVWIGRNDMKYYYFFYVAVFKKDFESLP